MLQDDIRTRILSLQGGTSLASPSAQPTLLEVLLESYHVNRSGDPEHRAAVTSEIGKRAGGCHAM